MDQLGEAEVNFLRAKLQTFLSRNPESEVRAEGRDPAIARLWGDEGIEVPLRSDDGELFEALNSVRLPPPFTAIWHDDTGEFEAIYTILDAESPLLDRSFEFLYRGNRYDCCFGPSSERLRVIAQRARPSSRPSRSDFRNLQPFYRFERMLEEHPDSHFVKNGNPTSFWIKGIESYDDDRIGDLVRNLNFYMYYFDRNTPTILIHEESVARNVGAISVGLNDMSFPNSLSGQDLDQHLLILWASSQSGDPILRFIHYYQILEYAGFYHVKNQIRREMERALVAPDAASRPSRVAQQILDSISADRRTDEQKISAMIEECVDLQKMWEVIELSLGAFAEAIELDGGFVLPPLVNTSTSYDDFSRVWNNQFTPALHRIRNALVHARESRQSTMIAPTNANRERLAPWLVPLSETAAQVMLYSRL